MDPLTDNIEYTNEYDKLYNKVARDQAAYISLLFPLIYFIILFKISPIFGSEDNVVVYVFNCIVSLVLFLPALFFLYKQLIRGCSELVAENLLFHLSNPRYVTFRDNCLAISKENRRKLAQEVGPMLEMEDCETVIVSDTKKRRDKKFKETIDRAIIIIREMPVIRKNHIVFEYNCVYGFFRNLTGGAVINLILYYVCKCLGVLSEDPTLTAYCDKAVPMLWIAFVLFLIFAWSWRVKYFKRMAEKFVSVKTISDETTGS